MKKALIGSVAIICLLAINALVAEDDEKSIVSMPSVTLSGTDSHVSERGYQRILTLDEWARVWQKHKGQKSDVDYDYFYDPLGLPLVDFSQFMVIAVFEGHRVNGTGLMAESILEDEDSITLRFNTKPYSTLSKGPSGGFLNEDGTFDRAVIDRLKETQGRKKVNVYGFFVIPRSDKSVILEEAVYRAKNQQAFANPLKPGFDKSKLSTTDWKQCIKFDEIKK